MANRALTEDMITELTAKVNRPVIFYEGVFVGFTMRLWNGTGELIWNGETWLGNGWFQGFQGIEEDNDLGSTGMEIVLAGVPLDLISTMLGNSQQGASGKLWLGFLATDQSVIEDPYLMFDGKLDVPTIDDKVDGPLIQISYESELLDLDRSKEYRYTPESQKIFNATDRGFDYVAQIATGWKGQWGKTEKKPEKKKDRENAKQSKGGGKGGGKKGKK